MAGVSEVLAAFKPRPKLLIHAAESEWLSNPTFNLSEFSDQPVTAPGADAFLEHGQSLDLGGLAFEVRHTPGHSPGSVSFHCPGAGMVISGDALFAGSIGRTDFPGCDHATLERSIRTQLYTLPGETQVFPGHGPATTVGREMMSNPYVSRLNEKARACARSSLTLVESYLSSPAQPPSQAGAGPGSPPPPSSAWRWRSSGRASVRSSASAGSRRTRRSRPGSGRG